MSAENINVFPARPVCFSFNARWSISQELEEKITNPEISLEEIISDDVATRAFRQGIGKVTDLYVFF